MKMYTITIVAMAICFGQFVNAFNVDVGNYIRHEGQPESMFGFSVTLHQEAQRSWVIIGAPTADTSSYQEGVRRGGAVYRCDISDDNRCQIIPFDSNGNQYNERKEQVDTKSYQWFGATVASAGIDGPLVACAPRYVFHTLNPRKVERVEPVGTCYIAKNNFQSYSEYSPCRTMYWGYHRQGSCQAGLSAAVTRTGDRVFVGAPGSWYWQGQAYSISTEAVFPYKPPRYGQFGEGGQIYSFSLNDPKDRVYSTGESTAVEDDSYLGYSSATGDFTGTGAQGVAIGMPRGGGLLGKVLLYSWNMTNLHNITGEQIGAYFGYSLCSLDVDGDGLDDLIIGAPMYTEPNNEGKYETGRVYIIYQEKYNKFTEIETRDGVNSKARFGLSLASLKDINLDGFGDFAVGAPYDGPNGRGAVYIYHGSSTGPLAKHSQVIFAEEVAGTSLSTFGFSVGGGIDLDGNMYPDMVVGAYNSNKAIVFKSRPVAVMEATTTFESETKLISLDDKNCTLTRDRKQVTCTSVNSCMKYRGQNLPATIDIEVSWVLDAKKPRSPRMFFLNDEGRNIRNSTMRLYRGKLECRNERVYITDNIRDKLTPLEVEMRYNFRSTSQAAVAADSSSSRRRRAVLEPVLDQNRGTVQRDSINIQKNCGSDNVCIPDLRLEVKTVEKYLLGSKDLMVLEILISNFGEDAFEAGYYMTLPHGLNFKKIERIGDIRDTPITCTAPSAATNNTLKCDIGNPLSSGKVANFKVILNPSDKSGMTPAYDFYMEANSTNAEQEGAHFDNVIKKSIQIWVETDLSITGKSFPPEVLYNNSAYKSLDNVTYEHELGPQVVHIYNIRNNGPSTIEEAEVFLLWPIETHSGDPLMYLLNQPETSGNIRCDPTVNVNERDYFIDTDLERKSYLEMAGVAITNTYYSRAGYHGFNYQGTGVHVEKSGSGSGSSSSSSGGGSYSSSSGSSSGSSYNRGSASGKSYSGGSYSGGAAAGSGGGRTATGVLTQNDKKLLDAEEEEESTGDASYVHRQRAGEVQSGSGGRAGGSRSGGSGGSYSSSSAWNSSSSNNGPTYTYSSSRNRSGYLGEDGKWRYTEASTENYGNVVLAAGLGGGSASRGSSSGSSASQSSRTYGQNQNVNYGDSYSRTSGGSEILARTGGAYRGNDGSRATTGVYRVEDIPTEEIVSQDISGLSSRTQNQQQGSRGSSATRTSSSEGGRTQNASQGFENGESGRWSSSADGRQSFNTGSGKESWSAGQSSGGSESHSSRGSSGKWAASGSTVVNSKGGADGSASSTRRRMKSQQDGEPLRPDLETGVTNLEKLAQGRSGFQTSTFELPQVQRNNVDEDLRHRSQQTWAANGNSGGSASSQQSGGGGSRSSSSWQSSSGQATGKEDSSRTHSSTSGGAQGLAAGGGQASHSSRTSWSSGSGGAAGSSSSAASSTNQQSYDDDDYSFDEYDGIEDEYSSHNVDDTRGESGGHTNKQHSRKHDGHQQQDGGVDDKFKHYQRFRRQAFDADSDEELKKALKCDATRCAILRCVAGPLLNQKEAWIALRTRLVAATMHKIGSSVPLTTSTMAVARISKLPYIGTPKERQIKTHELQVKATPEPTAAPDVVPLWVVVLAACAGTIILLLLIYLLYKCGFFKRNRPSAASSERQPLNRNGNYHGDEHL